MSRGPPTTPPVGLARKRRAKRSYDKFGVPLYPIGKYIMNARKRAMM